jgi:hypothetical protein
MTLSCSAQDLQIDEEVDVIVSEWMGYMLLYEVIIFVLDGLDRLELVGN